MNDSLLIVDVSEETAVFHVPSRIAKEYICFCLELQDGDSLVHHGSETDGFLIKAITILVVEFWLESIARIVSIVLHSISGERHKIDAIAFFKRYEVCVAQRKTYYIADTSVITGSCTHPQYVVVAPLYIPGMVL